MVGCSKVTNSAGGRDGRPLKGSRLRSEWEKGGREGGISGGGRLGVVGASIGSMQQPEQL